MRMVVVKDANAKAMTVEGFHLIFCALQGVSIFKQLSLSTFVRCAHDNFYYF